MARECGRSHVLQHRQHNRRWLNGHTHHVPSFEDRVLKLNTDVNMYSTAPVILWTTVLALENKALLPSEILPNPNSRQDTVTY